MRYFYSVFVSWILVCGAVFSHPNAFLFAFIEDSADSAIVVPDITSTNSFARDTVLVEKIVPQTQIDTLGLVTLNKTLKTRFDSLSVYVKSLLDTLLLNSQLLNSFSVRYDSCAIHFLAMDSLFQNSLLKSDSLGMKLPELLHDQKSQVDLLDALKQDILNSGLVIGKDVNPSAAKDSVSLNVLTDSSKLLLDTIVQSVVNESIPKAQPSISAKAVDPNQMDDQFLKSIYENDTTSLRSLLTGFDKESLMRAWELYRRMRFRDTDLSSELSQITPSDSLRQVSVGQSKFAKSINDTVSSNGEFTVNEFIKDFSTLEKEKGILSMANGDVNFVVQICAAKEPLTDHYLKSIYKGDLVVTKREEEGWFKYQIGETNDYKKARLTLKDTGIKGAFIVAYYKGEKLSLWDVLHGTSSNKPNVAELPIDKDLVLFGVQILAAKDKATSVELRKVYNGKSTVYMSNEEGWFKYLIISGQSMKDAKNLLKQLDVKGSFVVAYLNGKRITTKEAIKLLQTNKNQSDD